MQRQIGIIRDNHVKEGRGCFQDSKCCGTKRREPVGKNGRNTWRCKMSSVWLHFSDSGFLIVEMNLNMRLKPFMILNLLNLPLTTTSTNFALLTAFSQVSQLFLLINVLYVVFLACGGTTLCVQSKIPKHLLVKKKGLLHFPFIKDGHLPSLYHRGHRQATIELQQLHKQPT